MEKLSSDEREVLAAVPGVIESLAMERDAAVSKLAHYERRAQAEKVASAMHKKGIEGDIPFEALVDRMEKAAERGELETIERAVDMVAPDMGTKIASLSTDERRATLGGSDLERFVVGDLGLAAPTEFHRREKERTS